MTRDQADPSDQTTSDRSDLTKPWTIKNISWEARNAAIAASDREGLTIGAWLERAILNTIKSDRQSDRAPVVIEPPPRPQVDLTSLERLVAMAEKVATASGRPLPRDIRSKAHRLLKVGLAALESPTPGVPKSD